MSEYISIEFKQNTFGKILTNENKDFIKYIEKHIFNKDIPRDPCLTNEFIETNYSNINKELEAEYELIDVEYENGRGYEIEFETEADKRMSDYIKMCTKLGEPISILEYIEFREQLEQEHEANSRELTIIPDNEMDIDSLNTEDTYILSDNEE